MGGPHGLMDNLTYTYSGNRLSAVNDAVSGEYEVDFVKRGGGTYGYHVNGALNSDENEKISSITYNTFLNLPEQVNLNDGRWIKYTYDGAGTLLKTEYSNGEYWEYVEGVVFKNGQPYQMAIPEGRAAYESSQWKLEYDIKDHLGNTRVSFREGVGGAELKAKTDFDPWGGRLNGTGVVNGFQNRWELQGKEKEMTFNLNRINFGARHYNATIGRFLSVDAAASDMPAWSPYNAFLNNPLRYIDPDGNAPLDIILRGKNNSSITVKTDLVDLSLNVGGLGVDFGGNYSLSGRDVLQAAVDIGGVFDPTGALDVIGAKMSYDDGDYWGAGASLLGAAPILVGDLAKAGKISKGLDNINDAIGAAKATDAKALLKQGRSGKQERLRELATDPKVGSADRGRLKNEIRHVETGNRKTIRNPRNSRNSNSRGTELAHPRGQRAKDGHSYKDAKFQDADLHKLEHKHGGYK